MSSLVRRSAHYSVAHSLWSTNLHPYLQAAYVLPLSTSRQMVAISTVVEAAWALPIGLLVRQTGYFKPIILVALPLYCLGGVLMIATPKLNHSFGRLVFSQVLLAVAHSSFDSVKEVALLSGGPVGSPSIALALLSLAEKLGGTCGATLSDKLWNGVLDNAPKRYLTTDGILGSERVHATLAEHLCHPPGSAERIAIQKSYDDIQRLTLIISMAFLSLPFLMTLAMRNENVLDDASPKPSDTAAVNAAHKQVAGATEPGCSESCELGLLHSNNNQRASSFVHLHHPAGDVCVSAASCASGGEPFILHPIDPTVFREHLRTGRRSWTLSEPAKREHRALSRTLDDALQKACRGLGLPETQRIGVPETSPLRPDPLPAGAGHDGIAGPNAAARPGGVTWSPFAHRIAHPISLHCVRAPKQAKPAVGQQRREPNSDSHPSGQDTRGPPMFAGALCGGCCLDQRGRRCPDARSWVHVHLSEFGMCWTFRWEPEPGPGFRRLTRLGQFPGRASVALTDRQRVQLRAAVERNITQALDDHFRVRAPGDWQMVTSGAREQGLDGEEAAQAERGLEHTCGCSACAASNAMMFPYQFQPPMSLAIQPE